MPTAYPGGLDAFGVPSLPEETPLSSSGDSTRAHTPLLRDLGDAVEALQVHAAQKTHNHDGSDDSVSGPKLLQANTHESADTDSGVNSLHHTLGTGANQAAPGNHIHTYASLTGKPIVACTSLTRPSSPTLGLLIYETDTYRLRSWAQYPGDGAPSWRYLLGPTPSVRLRQGASQKFDIGTAGTIVEWREELEDSYGMFDKNVSLTNITCKESALYQVTAAIQWDTQFVPDVANVVIKLNNQDTTVRQQQFLRGSGFNPGFSQTLTVSGPLRMAVNDILTVKVFYTAPGGLLNKIFSYWDPDSNINSRLDIAYLGP